MTSTSAHGDENDLSSHVNGVCVCDEAEAGARWSKRRYVTHAAAIVAGEEQARPERANHGTEVQRHSRPRQGHNPDCDMPFVRCHNTLVLLCCAVPALLVVLATGAAALSLRVAAIWPLAAGSAGDACWTGEAVRAGGLRAAFQWQAARPGGERERDREVRQWRREQVVRAAATERHRNGEGRASLSHPRHDAGAGGAVSHAHVARALAATRAQCSVGGARRRGTRGAVQCSDGGRRIDGVAPIPSPRPGCRSFWRKSGAEGPVRQAAVAGIKPPAPPNFKNPFRPAHSAASPPHRPPPRCCKLRIIRDSIARTLIICLRLIHRGFSRASALSQAPELSRARARPDPSASLAPRSTQAPYRHTKRKLVSHSVSYSSRSR
ncbi:hypothetical protein PSPO01_11225 [Paraphaeosphaeria sporulosa]